MIIDCISDLHGFEPELPGGDLLIISGDLTAGDTEKEYIRFFDWISLLDHYRKKILISGNHDNGMVGIKPQSIRDPVNSNYELCEYICDSGTELEGVKIWGTPWTRKFEGENPNCLSFTCRNDEELSKKWALIPNDTDILITHAAAYLHNDTTYYGQHVGSWSLLERIAEIRPSLHVCGHIHESHAHCVVARGIGAEGEKDVWSINASIVDRLNRLMYKPTRVNYDVNKSRVEII